MKKRDGMDMALARVASSSLLFCWLCKSKSKASSMEDQHHNNNNGKIVFEVDRVPVVMLVHITTNLLSKIAPATFN